MLSRKQTKELRKAIEKSTVEGLEAQGGECYAETPNQEYGYSWQDGETRILVEDEDTHESDVQGHPSVEYVFRVRVELVAVVPR